MRESVAENSRNVRSGDFSLRIDMPGDHHSAVADLIGKTDRPDNRIIKTGIAKMGVSRSLGLEIAPHFLRRVVGGIGPFGTQHDKAFYTGALSGLDERDRAISVNGIGCIFTRVRPRACSEDNAVDTMDNLIW